MIITVDIDTKDKAVLRETYERSKKYGKTDVTETAHGYHLRIHSRIRNIWKVMRIRKEELGDDPMRILHDTILIKMGYPELANRLFERKKNLADGKWVYEKTVKIEEVLS